jgi:pilus assembly protein CpaC
VKGLLNSAATVPANFLDNGLLDATVSAGTGIPTNVLVNTASQINESIATNLSNSTTSSGLTNSTNSIAGTLSQMIPGAKDFTSWIIDAQKQDGLVKVLAEPNIVAISGQEGRFLVGGEIMIPVTGREGEVTLESKEFGIGLSFTPTVLEEGRMNIRVSSAVTDLISINPVRLSARKAATTVQLRDGQSLAIGGLLQDNFREAVQRFPVLGEIPILGTLFRSSEYRKEKTELLIVVTPRLVKPLAPDYILPTDGFVEPSRSELLFGGKMEGGKSQTDQSAPKANAEPKPASGGFEMK